MQNNNKKLIKTRVVSNTKYSEGTLIVERVIRKQHAKYKKIIEIRTRYAVQYEAKEPISIGSEIFITQCRPYSKTKRHIVMDFTGDNK